MAVSSENFLDSSAAEHRVRPTAFGLLVRKSRSHAFICKGQFVSQEFWLDGVERTGKSSTLDELGTADKDS